MNENEWRKQVLDLAHSAGWSSWYTAYSLYSTPGWPDLALVRPPTVILAELKGPRGQYRKGQAEAAALLESCHDLSYHLWRPDHLEQVAAVLGVNVRQQKLL